MYSRGSLIGMIYDFLESGYETDRVFKMVPEAEKDCLNFIDELSDEIDIPFDIYDEVIESCTETMLANEIKGFMSGIYFALKLKDEYKEEMEKIKECINLNDK